MEEKRLSIRRLFIMEHTALTEVLFALLAAVNFFPTPTVLRPLYLAVAFHLRINARKFKEEGRITICY